MLNKTLFGIICMMLMQLGFFAACFEDSLRKHRGELTKHESTVIAVCKGMSWGTLLELLYQLVQQFGNSN